MASSLQLLQQLLAIYLTGISMQTTLKPVTVNMVALVTLVVFLLTGTVRP